MTRLCRESSCACPERSVRRAVRAATGVELRPISKGVEPSSKPKVPVVARGAGLRAILQVLSSIFDPEFSVSSFGFRPQRCAHGALKQVKRFLNEGYRTAVYLDLERFLRQCPARRLDGPRVPESDR